MGDQDMEETSDRWSSPDKVAGLHRTPESSCGDRRLCGPVRPLAIVAPHMRSGHGLCSPMARAGQRESVRAHCSRSAAWDLRGAWVSTDEKAAASHPVGAPCRLSFRLIQHRS
jgi:hypothetical protein